MKQIFKNNNKLLFALVSVFHHASIVQRNNEMFLM